MCETIKASIIIFTIPLTRSKYCSSLFHFLPKFLSNSFCHVCGLCKVPCSYLLHRSLYSSAGPTEKGGSGSEWGAIGMFERCLHWLLWYMHWGPSTPLRTGLLCNATFPLGARTCDFGQRSCWPRCSLFIYIISLFNPLYLIPLSEIEVVNFIKYICFHYKISRGKIILTPNISICTL